MATLSELNYINSGLHRKIRKEFNTQTWLENYVNLKFLPNSHKGSINSSIGVSELNQQEHKHRENGTYN